MLYAAPCPLLAIPRITRVSRISIPFGLAAGTRDVSERVKNELYETCGDFYWYCSATFVRVHFESHHFGRNVCRKCRRRYFRRGAPFRCSRWCDERLCIYRVSGRKKNKKISFIIIKYDIFYIYIKWPRVYNITSARGWVRIENIIFDLRIRPTTCFCHVWESIGRIIRLPEFYSAILYSREIITHSCRGS